MSHAYNLFLMLRCSRSTSRIAIRFCASHLLHSHVHIPSKPPSLAPTLRYHYPSITMLVGSNSPGPESASTHTTSTLALPSKPPLVLDPMPSFPLPSRTKACDASPAEDSFQPSPPISSGSPSVSVPSTPSSNVLLASLLSDASAGRGTSFEGSLQCGTVHVSPGDKPLSAFARATPVRVFMHHRPPISGVPASSPLHENTHLDEQIHEATVDALAMMDLEEHAALVASDAVAQGTWLETTLRRAKLDFTASPIKLPKASKAQEYTIPGSTQPLWVVALRAPVSERVQLTETPSSRRGLPAPIPSAGQGVVLVDMNGRSQHEQDANNTPRRGSKRLAATKWRDPELAPPQKTDPPRTADEVARMMARLPTNASTPMEAVIRANRGLSVSERAIVQASPSATDAWRREVIRLWKVKRGWLTESGPALGWQGDSTAEFAPKALSSPSPADSGPSARASSATAASLLENPFNNQNIPSRTCNAFAAQLRRGIRPPLEPRESVRCSPTRNCRNNTPLETSARTSILTSPLPSLKPPWEPQPESPTPRPRAHVVNVDHILALASTKPPPRAASHNHAARKQEIYLEAESMRVQRRYNQPMTLEAWVTYARKIEADAAEDTVRLKAEIRSRVTASRRRHEQEYTIHATVRGAHQWAHVAPLASGLSPCVKFLRLTKEYPKWVVGHGVTRLSINDTKAPCHGCAGIAKDKELWAWLKLQLKSGRLDPDLAATTQHDAVYLGKYLSRRAKEKHVCPETPLDCMPEDAVTLLELRIFYGLGDTPTIPCLFWSCPAAYDAAAVKLVRIRSHVDLRHGPVDPLFLKCINNRTSTLRKELYALGAFVGWLPLDYGSEPNDSAARPHHSKQYLSSKRTPERKPTGPDWLSYRQTYSLLGPDASFWYDRLDRGIVMFNACYSPGDALHMTPLTTTPLRNKHIARGVEHLGAVYNLVSLSGPRWRTFEDDLAAVIFPPEFAGTSVPVIAVRKSEPNLAQSLSNALFELAVRVQAW
ncbi:hypothetical protein CC85DRAFT_79329 [Cutaneotrichosporon oleaginosum]|uniref:Uncharacterized protein n=1 Tax=Cutaneotrichosporon oleaginosum TaxID=879819 RepID=A0A0J0XN83_9TREE|nr:uncharacterized protein CC85DRAFT_79329 [Cutaneotrichosporon oleaginosum]KLT42585.1 hypothetical protein CC85DRAFT_79329 [Cutaneotrichosporon oleaginosum]TXT05298.1 hypothetical protein COLE_06618 [Cutaneotrichosporon oleaginosum]